MDKYLFMKPVLQLLSVGHFFRKAFALFVQILAVAIAVAGFVAWIGIWRSFIAQNVSLVFGVSIFEIFFLITIYAIVHTMFIRAADISALPDADYTVIPIVSIAIKLCGEVCACFSVVMGLAGGILIWFIGGNAFYFIRKATVFAPNVYGYGPDFSGGLMFIVSSWLMSFIVLALAYFFAETAVVLADIGKNTRITREVAEQYIKE